MRLYPVVTTLIILNIVLHLIKIIPGIGPIMYLMGIGSNEMVAYGEWWRLITPMFLHADFMHLLMNMFSLYIFGPDLEKLIGKMRFITLFLLSGIFANVATYFLQPLSYIHVGASGAIFGIFGAFLALVYYTTAATGGQEHRRCRHRLHCQLLHRRTGPPQGQLRRRRGQLRSDRRAPASAWYSGL